MQMNFPNAAHPSRFAALRTRLPVLTAACLLLAGCGNDDAWQAETQPVQGSIRINGEAPRGAVVTLYPTGQEVDIRESKPWGVVDENGVYALRTYDKGDGAPQGEFDVTLVWRENPSIPGSPDMLAGAYDQPSESQWKVTIAEGQTELPAIDVTGARVAPRQPPNPQRPSPFEDSGAP